MAQDNTSQEGEHVSTVEPDETTSPAPIVKKMSLDKPRNKFQTLWHNYITRKKITIPLTIIFVAAVILAIPFSRYKLLGLFIQRQFSIVVVDAQTGKAVSSADVSLAGKTTKTDNQGKASVMAKVGDSKLLITKKYYKDISQTVLVSLSTTAKASSFKMQATGRQVPVSVINKLTGKGVENVTVKISGTEARTDKDGNATIVLPVGQSTLPATLSAAGFNDVSVTVAVTNAKVVANNFAVVPAGKIYFLSKATGKIDVVKTNLDGSDRQTVLPGTGYEDDTGTVLLASRDWKYLALLSVRSAGGQAQLNLITTATDKLTNIDQGNASFSLTGWADDTFVYVVNRQNVQIWQPNNSSIKSFNATTGKLITLDNTSAVGTDAFDSVYEAYGDTISIIGNQVVFYKNWRSYEGEVTVANQQNTLVRINTDGSSRKTLSSVDALSSSFNALVTSAPDQLLVQVTPQSNGNSSYYTVDASGTLAKSSVTDDIFNNANYSTYLISPSGKQAFWYEERDGKNTLFTGAYDASNPQTIGSLTDYVPYGWYSDNYLLVSKNSSELYVLSNAPIGNLQPLKITDYHKPAANFSGYGGGYGGL